MFIVRREQILRLLSQKEMTTSELRRELPTYSGKTMYDDLNRLIVQGEVYRNTPRWGRNAEGKRTPPPPKPPPPPDPAEWEIPCRSCGAAKGAPCVALSGPERTLQTSHNQRRTSYYQKLQVSTPQHRLAEIVRSLTEFDRREDQQMRTWLRDNVRILL